MFPSWIIRMSRARDSWNWLAWQKPIPIRILHRSSPRAQFYNDIFEFKDPLGAVQKWRQHRMLEGRTPPLYPSVTRPKWPHTLGLKSRPPILWRQLFPIRWLTSFLDGPLRNFVLCFDFKIVLEQILCPFEHDYADGVDNCNSPLTIFASVLCPFPKTSPEVLV